MEIVKKVLGWVTAIFAAAGLFYNIPLAVSTGVLSGLFHSPFTLLIAIELFILYTLLRNFISK